MKSEKLNKIRENRKKVLSTLFRNTSELYRSFDEIVKISDLPRNEVAFYLAVLLKRKQIIKNNKGYIRQTSTEEIVDSYNEFMHGCSNPMHVHGLGNVNPNSALGRRILGEY